MDYAVFLETTIQADRNFSYKSRREEIEKNLQGKTLLCSTYVLGEFINNFLKNAVTFYNLLVNSENTNDALSRLGQVLYSERQFDRVIKIFSAITEDGNMSKKDVLLRLDMLIEDLMVARFFRKLYPDLLNQTECIRANARPLKVDGHWKLEMGCSKKLKPPCNIIEFINSNSQTFKQIESINEQHMVETIEIVKEINNKETVPCGRKCWKIGDVIICQEPPGACLIYTTNIKDFEPICNIIKKQLFCPNQ